MIADQQAWQAVLETLRPRGAAHAGGAPAGATDAVHLPVEQMAAVRARYAGMRRQLAQLRLSLLSHPAVERQREILILEQNIAAKQAARRALDTFAAKWAPQLALLESRNVQILHDSSLIDPVAQEEVNVARASRQALDLADFDAGLSAFAGSDVLERNGPTGAEHAAAVSAAREGAGWDPMQVDGSAPNSDRAVAIGTAASHTHPKDDNEDNEDNEDGEDGEDGDGSSLSSGSGSSGSDEVGTPGVHVIEDDDVVVVSMTGPVSGSGSVQPPNGDTDTTIAVGDAASAVPLNDGDGQQQPNGDAAQQSTTATANINSSSSAVNAATSREGHSENDDEDSDDDEDLGLGASYDLM
ncbi:hypothetical protein BC831DRAFT_452153 [Entophlyctis helioformis]|nr:hypothetical protein BC831DRAFT_452153 [Entophlyctis helioformis]